MANPVDHASLRSAAAERLRSAYLVALHFFAPLARPCHLRFGRAVSSSSLPAQAPGTSRGTDEQGASSNRRSNNYEDLSTTSAPDHYPAVQPAPHCRPHLH